MSPQTEFTDYLNEVAHQGRTALLPVLHKATDQFGWLSRDVLEQISRALRVPASEVHGVVEFYSMFYNQPTAKRVIRVCNSPSCAVAGSEQVLQAIEKKFGIRAGETSADEQVSLESFPCLGLCELAPVALDGKRTGAKLCPESVSDFLSENYLAPVPPVYGDARLITARIGKTDPTRLQDYLAHGGYQTLQKVLAMPAEALSATLGASGVLGRGGAQFPTDAKWNMVKKIAVPATQKHLVVNADESEPGTFKDRYPMEQDPFSLVEAITIAAYTVGIANGWIFIRGEYPLAIERVQNAVVQARAAGWLGKNIAGVTGFDFDIEVRVGAGAYICGEETALFEAIEGKRGFPRIKPPYPPTSGLFSQPTVINNVETLLAMKSVLEFGLPQWKALGTEKSPGTKLFCLSGQITQPGLYEFPFGITTRQLIEAAGGLKPGRSLQAVLMGGAAGVFISAEQIDIPLTYEDLRAANVPLGSGVVMVFDDTADLRQICLLLAEFFKHESCGKCFPCSLGTQRQLEIVERVAHGTARPADVQILNAIGYTMTKTSLCGLGQTASSAILSAMKLWPALFA